MPNNDIFEVHSLKLKFKTVCMPQSLGWKVKRKTPIFSLLLLVIDGGILNITSATSALDKFYSFSAKESSFAHGLSSINQ